jgi:hypothetical protein
MLNMESPAPVAESSRPPWSELVPQDFLLASITTPVSPSRFSTR